ncbi:hypothetical protein HMPREF1548_01003 [Clostridium sp. KLE 1755]|nr:hypothetical protein HMPREF1548_01003 [Clostridium sp. KLE 1755]
MQGCLCRFQAAPEQAGIMFIIFNTCYSVFENCPASAPYLEKMGRRP